MVKYMKKLIIILSSILLGLGILIFCIFYFRTPKIICNQSIIDNDSNALLTKQITIYFHKDKTYKETHMKLTYKFDDENKYKIWKDIYLNSNTEALNKEAFTSETNNDDKNKTFSIFINIDASKLTNTEILNNFPTEYGKVKKYYENIGMTCK